MITFLEGVIAEKTEKTITLMVHGVGFSLFVAEPQKYIEKKDASFYTYMHWNQEKGPNLFGFETAFERTVFLLIIDCPKIGPSIGLSILSQMRPSHFLEAITSQNEKALSMIKEHLNIPSPFTSDFLKLDPDIRYLLDVSGSTN